MAKATIVFEDSDIKDGDGKSYSQVDLVFDPEPTDYRELTIAQKAALLLYRQFCREMDLISSVKEQLAANAEPNSESNAELST